MTEKLYLVKLRGMSYSITGIKYGYSYVIAENTDEAYQKVKTYLDEKDLGFTPDRELDSIKLIAENTQYPDCKTLLFL